VYAQYVAKIYTLPPTPPNPPVPVGFISIQINAREGTKLGGYGVIVGGNKRALFWSSPTATPINLHPAGFTNSEITRISGDYQYGNVNVPGSNIARWKGTVASFVNLDTDGGPLLGPFLTAVNENYGVGFKGSPLLRASVWLPNGST
jgi:hypothetical protein